MFIRPLYFMSDEEILISITRLTKHLDNMLDGKPSKRKNKRIEACRSRIKYYKDAAKKRGISIAD